MMPRTTTPSRFENICGRSPAGGDSPAAQPWRVDGADRLDNGYAWHRGASFDHPTCSTLSS
jgi:hypothetical protein